MITRLPKIGRRGFLAMASFLVLGLASCRTTVHRSVASTGLTQENRLFSPEPFRAEATGLGLGVQPNVEADEPAETGGFQVPSRLQMVATSAEYPVYELDILLPQIGSPVARMSARLTSQQTEFTFTVQGNLVSFALQDFLPPILGFVVNIYDEQGIFIGRLTSPDEGADNRRADRVNNYEIFDAQLRLIARAVREENSDAIIRVTDVRTNTLVGEMVRPRYSYRDQWDIYMAPTTNIDPRITLFLPAFKSCSDHARSLSRNNRPNRQPEPSRDQRDVFGDNRFRLCF